MCIRKAIESDNSVTIGYLGCLASLPHIQNLRLLFYQFSLNNYNYHCSYEIKKRHHITKTSSAFFFVGFCSATTAL